MIARVEYLYRGRWCLGDVVEGTTAEQASENGLEAARRLWRQGAPGVKVTVMQPVVVLERTR